jgi:hypothetical protein
MSSCVTPWPPPLLVRRGQDLGAMSLGPATGVADGRTRLGRDEERTNRTISWGLNPKGIGNEDRGRGSASGFQENRVIFFFLCVIFTQFPLP